MITIRKSPTADTRTCYFTKVTREQLLDSSKQHIHDVQLGLALIREVLVQAALFHDADKIANIDAFHADFVTGFKNHSWWDNHRKITRHHIQKSDGVPEDVNLIDVLEMIMDCIMAGMARKGEVYPLKLNPAVLQKAFDNTVELLKKQVVVEDSSK